MPRDKWSWLLIVPLDYSKQKTDWMFICLSVYRLIHLQKCHQRVSPKGEVLTFTFEFWDFKENFIKVIILT